MKHFAPVFLSALVLSACAGGPPAPPTLEYGTRATGDHTYAHASETTVSVSMMGQSLELNQEGTATFVVGVVEGSRGVDVRLLVTELDATLTAPMGAPVRVDESYVEGALEFSLDRLGNPTLQAEPSVREEASQMISGIALAHGFFPGLPGRAVGPGDSWVDTVTYESDDDMGTRMERSVLTYTVTGDTLVGGRSLLVFDVEGTTESEFDLAVSGMPVTQASNLEVSGQVLWDYQGGIMVESRRTASGTGTVQIPMAPGPVPIRLQASETNRLQPR